MNFINEIAKLISYKDEPIEEFEKNIGNSPNTEMGDYCLPCFSFAKKYHCSPMAIANEIVSNFPKTDLIEKCEVNSGYVNFFLNKKYVCKNVLEGVIKTKDEFFKGNQDKGKVICIDYCSVNLAKYLHIGHFRTTIFGEALARLYENFGAKVIRINYVGDYGLPFGKMIVAYKLWGNEKELKTGGIEYIQSLYVKFCANEEKDEKLLNMARLVSKNIEQKDGEDFKLYNMIISLTIEETKRLVEKIGVKFDDWRGESTYNDKMQDVVDELVNKKIAVRSEGAIIVDLNAYDMGVAVIQRSDGASLYVTRDIAACQDRYNIYKFDKMIYVTATQQNNHFQKLFKILEIMGKPYVDKLFHAGYGMIALPEGKIASRKGKQALFADILDGVIKRASEVVKDKEFLYEDKENVAKTISKGAIAYSMLRTERGKDIVFDIDNALAFDGDTAPYMQYTYARCCALLRKFEKEFGKYDNSKIDCSYLDNDAIFEATKIINDLKQTITVAKEKVEPCILAKAIMNLCSQFNKYYNENKIITENKEQTYFKISFVIAVQISLKHCLNLICIDTLSEM